MNDDPNPFASSHQNHYSAVFSCRADRRKMSNHCLELSSIFASSKSNPRFSSTKLSNSTFFSRSANNYRGKSKLASSSSFSTFLPSLNRKCSVIRVLKPDSELTDTTTKAFSPEVVGKRTDLKKVTHELVEQVIMKERPDALLPTMGGQTALNLVVALAESGALEKYGVELIGAKLDAIKKAEDRDLFKQAMKNIGLKTPPSGIGNTLDECFDIAERIGECFGFVEFGTC